MSKQSYLTDHNGKPSSMRFMSFVSLFAGVGLTALIGLIVYQGQDPANIDFLFNLILVWIVGAFAPKAVQKYIEGAFFPSDPEKGPTGMMQGTERRKGSPRQTPQQPDE